VNECDYMREAACIRSFGRPTRPGDDARFKVPWVWEGSIDRVLVMEHVNSTSVGDDVIVRLPQADRMFIFREMQTDPDWSDFLWNAKSRPVRSPFLISYLDAHNASPVRSNWSTLGRCISTELRSWATGFF
jgi:ABC1 atypical kinase-like domain